MSAPDVADVLAIRIAGERARMSDLSRLLPYAAAGPNAWRRTGFADRIDGRGSWAAELAQQRDGWERWHDEDAAQDGDLLVDELVALLMTRLLRSEGLDAGTFDAAEALLAELVERAGVPSLVLGQTQEMEALDHTKASASLRFPGSRIWDLPILVHEFAHHAVSQLNHIDPGLPGLRPLSRLAVAVAKTIADAGAGADRSASHANELLADAVATAACGPTYPVACLCLRVPTGAKASRDTDSHPAWRHRVATMREALNALSDETGQSRHRYLRETVVDPLAQTVLGSLPTASPAAEQAARGAVTALRKHRPGLVYAEADAAIELSERLGCRDDDPPAGATIAAVLDGAWRWRLSQPVRDEDDQVADLVVSYCRHITRAPAH